MTYTLTQDLITEPQDVAAGVCLADWQALEAFDVNQPEQSAQLILPKIVEARTAGLIRNLAIERTGDSPNSGGYGQLVPRPAREAVAHWWGNPVGQSFEGVVAWLRNPISQVSAHYVISPGRVTQILPLTSPSWANGNAAVNARSLTFELDPNDVAGTIITFVELLVHLVRSGDLHPDYVLSGHRDHYPTACPGAYYPRLGAIRTAATTTRLTPNNQEDDMPITDADIERIAKRTAQIIIEDHAIERPDHHRATLGQHVADIAQTCIALRDGDLPIVKRPDGSHRAELGLVLGNIEQRLVSIDDRIGGAK